MIFTFINQCILFKNTTLDKEPKRQLPHSHTKCKSCLFIIKPDYALPVFFYYPKQNTKTHPDIIH